MATVLRFALSFSRDPLLKYFGRVFSLRSLRLNHSPGTSTPPTHSVRLSKLLPDLRVPKVEAGIVFERRTSKY